MRFVFRFSFLLSLAFLAGCSDVGDTLGLGRTSPDEFSVVDRPPLSMPPNFDLQPPQPGVPRPQEVSSSQKAEKVLLGDKAISEAESEVEKGLLSKAGAPSARTDIRAVIDRESDQKIVGTRHLVDELLWWKEGAKDSGEALDPVAEAERLRSAKTKETSKPVSTAKPVIEDQ